MPRDAVSRTANVGTWLRKRNGGQKWLKYLWWMERTLSIWFQIQSFLFRENISRCVDSIDLRWVNCCKNSLRKYVAERFKEAPPYHRSMVPGRLRRPFSTSSEGFKEHPPPLSILLREKRLNFCGAYEQWLPEWWSDTPGLIARSSFLLRSSFPQKNVVKYCTFTYFNVQFDNRK